MIKLFHSSDLHIRDLDALLPHPLPTIRTGQRAQTIVFTKYFALASLLRDIMKYEAPDVSSKADPGSLPYVQRVLREINLADDSRGRQFLERKIAEQGRVRKAEEERALDMRDQPLDSLGLRMQPRAGAALLPPRNVCGFRRCPWCSRLR